MPLNLSWLWHGEQITNSRGVCFKNMNHITLALNVQCLDSIDCVYRPASQGQLSETWSCAAMIKAYSLLEVTCFYTWSFPEQPCKGGSYMHFPNKTGGRWGEGKPSLNNCEQIYLFYKASWLIEIMLYSSTQSIISFSLNMSWFIILGYILILIHNFDP